MKFNTFFSHDLSSPIEDVDSTVVTRPDRSLTIRQLIDRYTSGEDVSEYTGHFGGYDEEFSEDAPFDPLTESPMDYFNSIGIDVSEAFQIYQAYSQYERDEATPHPVSDSPQAPAQPEVTTEDPPDPSK